MRDNFVGDIGDYFKYGLLRCLCQTLRLGILWYHYPDEEKNGHGSKTDYLNNSGLSVYDPPLFSALHQLIQVKKERSISAVEKSGLFHSSSQYFNEPLSFLNVMPASSRQAYRMLWFQRGLQTVEASDLVFLDPDNGLQVKSVNPYAEREGPKYVAQDEVSALLQARKSILIYQHVRQIKPQTLLEQRCSEIRETTGYSGEILSVYLKARNEGDGRLFLLMPTEQHRPELADRLESFKQSAWKHFMPLEP